MYGANVVLSGTALMLLARLRRAINAVEDDLQLTDSELIARGISLQLEELGVSAHCNAAMLTGVEPEPA